MRYVLVLLAFAAAAPALHAEEPVAQAAVWPCDLEAAIARARTSGKLVLVYVSEPPAT